MKTRAEVYKEIRDLFGEVPIFIEKVPDSSLELEWDLMRRVQFDEGPIPNKYRELIGLGVAAARGCAYCAFFHTEVARLNGATDAEIEDAAHFAKSSMGWSTYLHALQIPLDDFKAQVARMVQYARDHQPVGAR
jgi:AhpD family alkylhydroperoxidase